MINTLNLLLLGTAQKTLITSWSLAFISLMVVESNPNLPDIISSIGYFFTGSAVAIGCFFLGRLLAQYQEQKEVRDFEAYLDYYKNYQKSYMLLQERMKQSVENVA